MLDLSHITPAEGAWAQDSDLGNGETQAYISANATPCVRESAENHPWDTDTTDEDLSRPWDTDTTDEELEYFEDTISRGGWDSDVLDWVQEHGEPEVVPPDSTHHLNQRPSNMTLQHFVQLRRCEQQRAKLDDEARTPTL